MQKTSISKVMPSKLVIVVVLSERHEKSFWKRLNSQTRCEEGSNPKQCDQIGRFLKVLATNLLTEVAQKLVTF